MSKDTSTPNPESSGASSEYIRESALVPDSAFVTSIAPTKASDDGVISESVSTISESVLAESVIPESKFEGEDASASDGLPKDTGPKKSAIKQNLPFIVLGALVVFGGATFLMKGGDQPQVAQPAAAAASQPQAKPQPHPQPQPGEAQKEASATAQGAIKQQEPRVDPVNAALQIKERDEKIIKLEGSVAELRANHDAAMRDLERARLELIEAQRQVQAAQARAAVPAAPTRASSGVAASSGAANAEASTKSGKSESVSQRPETPAPIGYSLKAAANGIAWVSLPSGETLVVSRGASVPGLGRVSSIDEDTGAIRVGQVTLR
jgi:hypothetical protein